MIGESGGVTGGNMGRFAPFFQEWDAFSTISLKVI